MGLAVACDVALYGVLMEESTNHPRRELGNPIRLNRPPQCLIRPLVFFNMPKLFLYLGIFFGPPIKWHLLFLLMLELLHELMYQALV